MGLKPDEVRRLTLAEFNMMFVGYRRRNEKDWDIARRTWEYILKYGGLGLKDGSKIDHKALFPLTFTDQKEDKIIKITKMQEALELLKEF